MLEIERMTTEEALRKALEADDRTVSRCIEARPGGSVTVRLYYEFDVPALYAKAIALEWVKEQLEAGKPI